MTGASKVYIAIDLGASSGRVVAGLYDGSLLELQEVHRFSTAPVEVDGTYRLEFDKFFSEICTGISKAIGDYTPVVSVGVSSWGRQTLAIDSPGNLLEQPYHYRDAYKYGLEEEVYRRMPERELYRITGMYESDIPALFAHVAGRSPDFSKASNILQVADYFNYRLSGVRVNEYTNARVTQLLDAKTGTWSGEILDAMSFPRRLFGEIVHPPAILGDIDERLLPATGSPVHVVLVGTHDTASAIAAAPLTGPSAAFLSLGTWGILGCEVPEPVITNATFKAGMQNNAITAGPVALVRNCTGTWLLEECRRSWSAEGRDYGFDDLVELARAARPFAALLRTDAEEFFAPGEMPARIRRACVDTGQPAPENPGDFARAIFESLALRYRGVLRQLAEAAGRGFGSLHVVGGGSRNGLLAGFIANACGIPVIAGPHEATSAGNIMAQMMADGELASLEEGRNLIKHSWPVKTFEPRDRSAWDDAFERLRQI